MRSTDLIIREATASDEPFLREMLYHSLYVPDGGAPFDRNIVTLPEIAKYAEGWGRAGDLAARGRSASDFRARIFRIRRQTQTTDKTSV
jgi:hypothetical protein